MERRASQSIIRTKSTFPNKASFLLCVRGTFTRFTLRSFRIKSSSFPRPALSPSPVFFFYWYVFMIRLHYYIFSSLPVTLFPTLIAIISMQYPCKRHIFVSGRLRIALLSLPDSRLAAVRPKSVRRRTAISTVLNSTYDQLDTQSLHTIKYRLRRVWTIQSSPFVVLSCILC